MQKKLAVALGVLVAFQSAPNISAQDQADVNRRLLEKVEELEAKIRVLERKGEITEETSAEKAKSAPAVSIGASGLSVRSADTNFVLNVRGYAQVDSRLFLDDVSPQNDTFLVRRLRPIFDGTVFGKFDYRLMLDFPSGAALNASNNALVQDAYLNARFRPEFQVQIGKFKEPVGLERLQSGSNLLFPERAYPTQLLPNRDVGIQLHGNLFSDRLSYAVGIFNGVSDGGSGDIDAGDDNKDVAARIFAHPFRGGGNEWLENLGLGIAGTFGDQEGPLRGYASPGQQRIFQYHTGAGTAAAPHAAAIGDHWRVSPQFYWYWRSFGIFGEYAISSQELEATAGPALTRGAVEHTAWQLAASYFLTGEDNSFNAVAPLNEFRPGSGGWGAWEVAARVSQIDFDDEAFPTFANASSSAAQATSYALGVNWHLNKNIKASLSYEHTEFEGGSSALLQSGEDVLFGRVQFKF